MKDNKIPSPLVSLLPVFVLILLLFVTIRTFGSDALSGGSQVCLLVATAVCVLIGMAGFRRPWKDFELAVTNNIAGVSTALIILLIIGALSGAWMVSGLPCRLISSAVASVPFFCSRDWNCSVEVTASPPHSFIRRE